MSDVSLEQITHLLSIISKKGVSGEHLQKLFTSGLFPDLLIGNIDAVNRDEFRKLLDLPKVGEQRIRHVIVTSDEGVPIHVDRSIQPDRSVYDNWVGRIVDPEIENSGPTDYNLDDVNLWLHEDQLNRKKIHGYNIYESLKHRQMIVSCLSLRDGEEIQKKGVNVFRKFFGNKSVFLWKSVAWSDRDQLSVPYLEANLSDLVIRSVSLSCVFTSGDVAAYVSTSQSSDL